MNDRLGTATTINSQVTQKRGGTLSWFSRAISGVFLGHVWVYHGLGTAMHIFHFILIYTLWFFILFLHLADTSDDPEYRWNNV